MCGLAGMFVGCAAVDYCPKRLLGDQLQHGGGPGSDLWSATDPGGSEYRSPFTRWDSRAAVRTAPRRELAADDDGLFFSPELVPVARHPLVAGIRPDMFREVLVQHLYRYLDFTTKLEHLVVNRTVLGIAHGMVSIELPQQMRFDAYKIYCDEAYHAVFSQDLLRQTVAHTQITPRLPQAPYFLVRLQQLQEGVESELRSLVELLFVVISETLISGTLAAIPSDPQVVPAVDDIIRDHAADEGRHHAYFAAFLRIMWGWLTPEERTASALLVPDLVDAFLQPDRSASREELLGYGLSEDAVEQVIAECWPDALVRKTVAASAERTVFYFRELGVLDDPRVAERFAEAGLVG